MDFIDIQVLIEKCVISILFVSHALQQACLCCTGTFMEMSSVGLKKTERKEINRNVTYFFKRGTNLL